MDEPKVKQIIEEAVRLGSETSSVEFKDARGGFPRDTWKTVSAFSHRPTGGFIVFGIKEDRANNSIEVTGVDQVAVLQEKMSDLVSTQMSVAIRPEYFPISISGKTVLIISKEKPQFKRSFNRYIVRCVKYKGSNVATDIIDKADIDGTLNEQIDTMQKFILRNIRTSAQIVGTKRVERYEYPEKAIREIVANAVIHRGYRITETYTQVNVFEDRLENVYL